MNSNLSVFVFPSISCIFGVPSKKPLPYPKHTKIYSHVFFRILIILDIIFKSMIHFELDFFIGVSYGFNFSFTCGYTVVPIPFVENSILFPLSCFGMFLENHLTQSFTFILIAGINILIYCSHILFHLRQHHWPTITYTEQRQCKSWNEFIFKLGGRKAFLSRIENPEAIKDRYI